MAAPLAAPQPAPLAAFLGALPEPLRLAARTLAHAWEGGGGQLQVGQHVARLTGPGDVPFTAAALHAAGRGPARLEFCRVILQSHGLPGAAWTHWSDDLADLQPLGFDPAAKFPALPLERLGPAELARLAVALRDLARMLPPSQAASAPAHNEPQVL